MTLVLALVLAIIIGVGAAAAALYRLGVRRARDHREAQEVNEYVEARRRMDAVDRGGDPDRLRDWLHDRASQ